MSKSKKVVVVTMPELGWDCVVCVADSEEAAAFYIETTVEKLKKNRQYVVRSHTVETQTEE